MDNEIDSPESNVNESTPTLSVDVAGMLREFIRNISLSLDDPTFEESAALWLKAKNELEAIVTWHNS